MTKPKASLDIQKIFEVQRAFTKERDWEKFHTPKNLAMALGVEAAELSEIFTWLTDEQSEAVLKDPKTAKKVKDELSDVLYYLLRLVDRLDIDLEKSFWEKMDQNRAKYPADKARGRMTKYDEL